MAKYIFTIIILLAMSFHAVMGYYALGKVLEKEKEDEEW